MAFRSELPILLFCILFIHHCNAEISSDTKEMIKSGLDSGTALVDTLSALGNPDTSRLFKTLGKMAGFLGAAGGLVSFILAFLPAQDSAELAYMKKQFTLVNTKLDTITSELDNIKDLIKYENQRAAYLPASNAILFGYRELSRFMNEIQRTPCRQKSSCKRIRARIASRFVNSFNVKHRLESILHATFQRTSVFRESLLPLVSKRFKCSFAKINHFSNGVLKLAFKGQEVILAHEKLTGSKQSIAQSMNDWFTNIYRLRSKTYSVKNKCFRSIKNLILKDVRNSDYQIKAKTNEIANMQVKTFLEKKYPWLSVVAFSYNGDAKGCTPHGGFWYMPKDKNARKRNLIVGIADKKGTYQGPKRSDGPKNWVAKALKIITNRMNFFSQRWDYCKVKNRLIKELKRKKVWKYVASLSVRKSEAELNIQAGNDIQYISDVYTLKWRYRYRLRNRWRYKTGSFKAYIVIVLKSIEQAKGRRCSLACKNGGKCILYPYSSSQYCQCKPFYQGTLCEKHAKAALAKTVDAMLATTLRLPVLSDVAFDIKDLRQFVGIGIANIQKSVSNLEASMQRKFNELSNNIKNQIKWANFITMYKESIQTIKYYAKRFEMLPQEYSDIEELQNEGRKLAIHLLNGGNRIRKALFQLNDLLVGTGTTPLLSHKPILFAYMKSRSAAGEPCTSSYKRAVDNYWRQLIILQQIGYFVWVQALQLTGRRTSIVNSLYKKRIAQQLSTIKKGTCQYDIKNSINVHCNRHYLHPGMVVKIRCKRNFYLRGYKQTTCIRKGSTCRPCNCFRSGSMSQQCANGQCRCKRRFYGKHCNKRDCKWKNWSPYGRCSRCGYGARKLRRRGKVARIGLGRRCSGPSIQYANCFKGCCRNQFHCSNRRKCIRSSWKCDYDNDCGDKQDERRCNEQCFTRHTWWSSHGGGKLVYLDRHRVRCYNGEALKMFHLQRNGGKVRYQYICCRMLKRGTCRNQVKYNRYTYGVHGSSAKYLKNQLVTCGSSAFLSSFRLTRNRARNKIRYIYNCCHLRHAKHRKRMSCYSRHTKWTYHGYHEETWYLKKQIVQCKKRYFLNGFRLQQYRPAWWMSGKFRYWYRCCKINV